MPTDTRKITGVRGEEEAARFLADRPYLPSARAHEVLAVHRRARV